MYYSMLLSNILVLADPKMKDDNKIINEHGTENNDRRGGEKGRSQQIKL